eukprot:maker-scaffold585_size130225-snap-gene-0.19 protein:Tk05223 transcript:maker-scaffold585_size130225-snap-gene-0.19-mRNA-1 annotation:"Strumpellin"
MEFLADNHACGRSLLRLVSRGHSTVAELLRLKDAVPVIYSHPLRNEQQRYGELIALDFQYFKTAESFEAKVRQNEALELLDLDLKETHLELLTRFYRLFESIQRFALDLSQYLDDLEDGNFIQQSLESVFLDPDGKQLLAESLYILGVMLLLIDLHLEGSIRERLLVAYYRYSGQHADQTHVDDICKLLRSTGFSKSNPKRPTNYPHSYFERIQLPKTFVDMVIGRLRTDDLYNQLRCYPLPEHRSVALSEQSAMLFVVLFFDPTMLKTDSSAMREIVDKYFSDNWVIAYYMGHVVNLVEMWEPYKAAKLALANTLVIARIKEISLKSSDQIQKLGPLLRKNAKVGFITEENALEQVPKTINLIRESNVALRWRMLHTLELTPGAKLIKKCRQLHEQVLTDASHDPAEIFQVLLNVSEIEHKFKSIYKKIWTERDTIWKNLKVESLERMADLAQIFGPSQPGVTVPRLPRSNEKLQKWCQDREKQILGLECDNPVIAGRLAVQLVEAISEVLDFDQVASDLQVKQTLLEVKASLFQLIRISGVKEEVLILLQIVGDIRFGWMIVDPLFTPFMQEGVKKDPGLVQKLKATFLKLASALEGPVLRISQAKSPDLLSVSQYYSSELVAYVRKVLQIIPETMFKLLDKVIDLQTHHIKEVPTRLDKDKMKDFAQLDERFEVARLTHSISIFTEGMLSMKSTLFGVIQVDPKRLLEDGIRKEIVRQVSKALHETLIFNPKVKTSELPQKLESLKIIMSGFRRSFEYIQDYVRISGLKIWQEEVSRVIHFNVEQEANLFLKQKVPAWDSVYQSKAIPIPMPPPSPVPDCRTFLGRLVNEVITMTSPKTSVYVPYLGTWYDARSKEEICSMSLFSMMEEAVGSFGLAGLDRLLGLKIVTCLQNMIRYCEKAIFRDRGWIEMLENLGNSLNPTENVIAHPYKFYASFLGRTTSLLSPVLEAMMTVGHLQLLREKLAYQLSLSSRFDSKLLHSSLQTLNKAVLRDVRLSDQNGFVSTLKESPLLYELSQLLNWSGLNDVKEQIYLGTLKPAPKMAELVALVLLTGLGRAKHCAPTGDLIGKRQGDGLDGHLFVLGTQCWLQQFPDSIGEVAVAYLAQYARSFAEVHSRANEPLGSEVSNTILFLDRLVEIRPKVRATHAESLPGALVNLIAHKAS